MNDSIPVPKAHGRLEPEHRLRAAHDLLCRIPALAPSHIADVFAGQGPMRPLLALRFPDAEIEAFDLSQSGDRGAEQRSMRILGQVSGGRFPATKKFDLISLNGSLELLPSLPRLLPVFFAMLAANGCLAVQIPNDLYEPSRALVRMIAAEGPWARTLLPIAKTRPFNESMEGLYALLSPISASLDIWEATYLHVMSGVAAIVELMEATRLAPFLAPLDPADRRKFLARYAAGLNEAYPAEPDGRVLLRLRRLFVVAQS
jgi:trans-aconitate 2-methyltransferase